MEIYLILNKANGKGYVGATKWTFNIRYSQGKWWKWTHNSHLKAAYQRYGHDQFEVQILEKDISDEATLYEREAFHISRLNTFVPNGYNLTRGGGSSDPSFVREYDLIDFNGNGYRVINLSKFCQKHRLNYSAMCNMVSGINASSHGYALASTPLDQITIPNEEWQIENLKTGEIVTLVRGEIGRWARSRGIGGCSIEGLVNGRVLTSYGWKLASTILPEGYRGNKPTHSCVLTGPNGERVEVSNVYAFCKERGLERGAVYDLIKGGSLEHKGWSIIANPQELKTAKELRLGKKVSLVSPTGEKIEVQNISRFCREHNFNRNGFDGLLKGRSRCYKGWKLFT